MVCELLTNNNTKNSKIRMWNVFVAHENRNSEAENLDFTKEASNQTLVPTFNGTE